MKVLAVAFLLFASTPIVIDTSSLAGNELIVRRDGSRTVTAGRDGDAVSVRIQEGNRVDTITMTSDEGGHLSITHRDNGEPRENPAFDRGAVIVDGIDLDRFLATGPTGTQQSAEPRVVPPPDPRSQPSPRYYICPNDETMVRVRPGVVPPAELECPLDGRVMRAGKGTGSQYFLLQ